MGTYTLIFKSEQGELCLDKCRKGSKTIATSTKNNQS